MMIWSVALLLSVAHALSTGMQYSESFLNGRLTFEWAIVDDNAIEILVTGQATGWIGVGVSPQGGMQGADITLGWLDSGTGEPVVSDNHVGDAPGAPVKDKQQNIKLISLSKSDGKLALRFRRGLDSCDPNAGEDLAIVGTSRVIVAMGEGAFDKHAAGDRASKSIDLRRGAVVPLPAETDLKNWDIKLVNAAMPGEQTTYWTMGLAFPATKKVHAVRFEVLIPPADLPHTHHYLLYSCKDELSASSLRWAGNRKSEPADVKRCVGKKPIYGWAIGGLDISIPVAGVPILPGQTFVLEIHIDRPQKQAIVANCGLRVIYTEQLRPYEATLVRFGAATDVWLTIPPTDGPSVRRAFCYRECTSELIPANTFAFAAMGHMHFAGRGFKLRHMRQNSEIELAPLVDNPTYDNALQSMTFFEKPVEIKPGDTFVLEGTFKGTSDGRKTPTFGGSSSWDEMMLAYVYMYSTGSQPVTLGDCSSSAVTDPMYRDLIAREAFGGVELKKGEAVPDFIERITDWSKYDSARNAAERSGKALIDVRCEKNDGTQLDISPKPGIYPHIEFAPPRVCVKFVDGAEEPPIVVTRTIPQTMSATTTNGAEQATSTAVSIAAVALLSLAF